MDKNNSQPFAFDFPEVRVVEASAGSGKTYALAKRYIQLLLGLTRDQNNVPLKQILAITFTNKAAFEMKARILDYLKGLALGYIPVVIRDDILGPLKMSPDEASRHAFRIMDELIRGYNYFQVQTIDKFINALLSGCAFKIGLTANFRIRTNARDYIQYTLDQMIDRAAGNPDLRQAFATFLHHYLYLENRSGWFPKDDLMSIIYTLFQEQNTYGTPFHRNSVNASDVVKTKAAILKQLQELQDCLPAGIDGRFRTSLDNFLRKYPASFDVDSLSAYFERQLIPLRKGEETSETVHRLWASIRQLICQLCEEESSGLFNPYLDIYHVIREDLGECARKDDILFLEELNKKAGLLFDEDYVTVEELYYRLATRYRHYLMDEFQDTSRLQWHNLEKMTEEALSTGGSLFYVGDRKQAIYGFRGGDARLFDEIKSAFHHFRVREEILDRNWRSRQAIVDFNNRIFNYHNICAFLGEKEQYEHKQKCYTVEFHDEDLATLENIYQAARQKHREDLPGGYVRIGVVDIDSKEDRDAVIRDWLMDALKDLRDRYALKDIAILTRSNVQVEQLTQWLLENGIRVNSERTSNIQENSLVEEWLAFLRFLDSPIDNFAFAHFITGEIFTAAAGVPAQTMHDFIFGWRRKLHKTDYLYIAFREAFPELWERYIQEFFKNVGLHPLYELMVTLYDRYQCLRHFPDEQGFLMHLLELVKKAEEDHGDLAGFLKYFEELIGDDLYVHMADRDAVQILTVHKSKGLEFPVVLLPFLAMDIQVGSGDQARSYVMHPRGQETQLMRIKSKYLPYSSEICEIYDREYKSAFLTELNNMYVALTRARDELYGMIPKRTGNKFNMARYLIPDECLEVGSRPSSRKMDEANREETPPLPPAVYRDWMGFLKNEYLSQEALTRREHRRRGEVIHDVLARMPDLSPEVDQQVMEDLLAEAQQRFLYNGPPVSALLEFCRHPEVQPFLTTSSGETYTEKEFVTPQGEVRRIDRLCVDSQQRRVRVADFKTGGDPDPDHQRQVRDYMTLLRDIYPGWDMEGFVIYMDPIRVVPVVDELPAGDDSSGRRQSDGAG